MSFNSHYSEEAHQFVANEAGVEAEENGQEQAGPESIQEPGLCQVNKSQYSKRRRCELGTCEQ